MREIIIQQLILLKLVAMKKIRLESEDEGVPSTGRFNIIILGDIIIIGSPSRR